MVSFAYPCVILNKHFYERVCLVISQSSSQFSFVLYGIREDNAIHTQTFATFDILDFIIREYAFFGFDVELIEKPLINRWFRLYNLFIGRDNLPVKQLEDRELCHS